MSTQEHPVWINGRKIRNICIARMLIGGTGDDANEFTECMHSGKLFKNKYYISLREPKWNGCNDIFGMNCRPLLVGHCVHGIGTWR